MIKIWKLIIVVLITQLINVASIEDAIGMEFKTINDVDESTFEIRRLPTISNHTGSCYELRKNGKLDSFCYPAILIPGVPKCGTSAMYRFLTSHEGIQPASWNKEHCPTSQSTSYTYLNEFSNKQGVAYVNGCLDMQKVVHIHHLLQPKTVYIIMVRNLSDWMWAAYNFWCKPTLDEVCPRGGWTKPGMYRAPAHFHELLMNESKAKVNYFTTAYKPSIELAKKLTGNLPLVMASEALNGPDDMKHKHIQRLQDYINTHLATSFTFNISNLHLVNTGDHRGTDVQSTHASAGLYEISGHKPMLPETVAYINSHWKLCEYISSLAQYSYNCSSVHDPVRADASIA